MSLVHFKLGKARACDEIDAELQQLAAVGRPVCHQGGDPSSRQVDELLDERGLDSDGQRGANPTRAYREARAGRRPEPRAQGWGERRFDAAVDASAWRHGQ
jgi:hypothetical protein